MVFVSSESGVQIPVEMIHSGMTKTAQLAVARVAMIVFVCGEPASATTGAALRVDGGVVRAIV